KFGLNVAVTSESAESVRTQSPVPLHAPPHTVKSDFQSGLACRVTGSTSLKTALQPPDTPLWQEIPEGALLTVPTPAPTGATVRV
ncbi:MAG TPA: hypothetical protein VN652_02075, partial [Geobacteraceae bacterium]|nr:hypothetical protein [Geobacteraceae bacterium]